MAVEQPTPDVALEVGPRAADHVRGTFRASPRCVAARYVPNEIIGRIETHGSAGLELGLDTWKRRLEDPSARLMEEMEMPSLRHATARGRRFCKPIPFDD